ncbi:diadenylate cyclase CdaA [Ancylothrix sp. C2]|uniref:diadenylate cyclase CdaA n=1 Tax=Ancylothrix sp. D3o TaxID=2953691 RepID=UPI0021BA9C14|nr:diadenylate cyclase CdaA [Ancylothrix sp. D3o]MCT7950728.1 diadenylate cyclase CdaA [Ancylothrix sp. D3o]
MKLSPNYDLNWTQIAVRQFIDIWTQWLKSPIDIGLVLALTYMVLVIIGERRTLWMVRGLIFLMLATAISSSLELRLLSFVLEKLVVGSAVAMAVILQSEFRRFLEQLGRGELGALFQPARTAVPKADTVVDEIVDAIKELSQNRTGALLILETGLPIDERDFSVPGVRLNAEVSKELLQTIFQTSTLLHDGAVLIRGSRILAAGVILPLSDRTASRQLGTRHRAAMGITEKVENCICVVVSEETGSISLAERGGLNRPLTSSKLKELLEARFSQSVDREAVAPNLRLLGRLGSRLLALVSRLLRLPSSASGDKK